MRTILSITAAVFVFANAARADIFQWEYINPADPSQGKRQSTTLAPDGAGVDAVPGANLSSRNLTMAYLTAANLTNANGLLANLTNADLTHANLTNTNLNLARLTNADFAGAEILGANFGKLPALAGTGITLPQLYSTASYQARDLRGTGFLNNNLAGANFVDQDLSNASFALAILTDADFSGAEVRGAMFRASDCGCFPEACACIPAKGTGAISLAQLYSTASYQNRDLSGVGLENISLTGGNFAGQNFTSASFTGADLTDAEFSGATLTDADFTGAEVRGAFFFAIDTGLTSAQLYSTASYQARNLMGIALTGDLSDWNFAGQNLINARFSDFFTAPDATLTEVDFTDAEVRGASFWAGGIGLTMTQLYSTASYQARDLTGIKLSGDLSSWNFAGQNLANADFVRESCNPYFQCMSFPATLTGADLTAADARGASLNLSSATTANLIHPDGHIAGLELDASKLLAVRDYNGYFGTNSIPITIDQHLSMAPGGTLRMLFEADAWDSTISFAPGTPVTLGGTLELTFADDVNPASQVGRTFDLFDWTGVNPTGAFAVSSPYAWDLSNLYTTGQVTLTAIPEPSTFALAALGLIGLVVRVRRSKSNEESHAETQRRRGISLGRFSLRPLRLCVSLLSLVAIPIPALSAIAGPIQSQSATVLHTYRKSTAMEVINAIPVDFHKVLPLLPQEYDFLPAAAVGLGGADQALVVIANFQGSQPQIDDAEPAAADQVAIDLAILVQEPPHAATTGLDIPGAFHVYTLAIYTNDAPYAATLQSVGMPVELVPHIVYDRPMDDLTGLGDLNVSVPIDDESFYSHNTGFGYVPAGVLNAILWHNGSRGTSVLHFMDEPTELGQALSEIYTAPGSNLNSLLQGGGVGPGPTDPVTGFESVLAPSLNYRYREGSFGRLLLIVPEPSTLLLLPCALAAMLVIFRFRPPHSGRVSQVAASFLSVGILVNAAEADIFQWEYINPADPSQGKQQSTTLAPDGAGVDAVPGAYLWFRNLTMAYLIGADVQNASFVGATLTGADFTSAEVRGANFGRGRDCGAYGCYPSIGTGIIVAQLYSTASYQAHELTGIGLFGNDLSGANFAGQNLTNGDFGGAELTGADFTGAEVRGANFVAGTCSPGFGCSFFGTGMTLAQLYSTGSYQAHDLRRINFGWNDLTDGNFVCQNLTNANFTYAYLSGADFSAADARGAFGLVADEAITANFIWPDGHMDGLDLDPGALLVVRDYDGIQYSPPIDPIPPIPITIDQHLTMAPGGTLRMVFEADDWDSTISFAPGIPVTLGGTLELTFSDDVNPASQVGRTFDLFDWTGVTPTGAFAISSPYAWDLSNLYTTGEVTLTAIPEPTSVALIIFAAAGLFAACRNRLCASFLFSLSPLLLVCATSARADIFQWEYINPADPSQGKQQSTTLAPDGAGVDAVPGANLESSDLTMAYLSGADLTGANAQMATLINADLSQANLTYAGFRYTDLTGTDLSDAEIQGASFDVHPRRPFYQNVLTLAQLYSTASYAAHELTHISLAGNDLRNGNFAGQNLSYANFNRALLNDADFTGAEVRGVNFARIDCFGCYLTGSGISLAQLYSTASYLARDLRDIDLTSNYLAGGNFAGQNLTNAAFGGAHMIGADFTGADVRGAFGLELVDLTGAATANLIRHDGHISGLSLSAGSMLAVRDYDGNATGYPYLTGPIPITVDQHFTMAPGGTLRMVFEADAWDSTISFAPGIPATLGGTLELTFAADVNPAPQIKRTFDLFNWTGVTPTGAFAVASPYAWDLSNLYTTGQVTLTAIPEPSALVLLLFGVLLICGSRRGYCIFAVVSLFGCVSSARADLPMTGAYVPEFQAVDSLLQSFMAGKPIPGGTITITLNDKVIYERGIGYSNAAKTLPMQETALMRLASLSKPVTASAVHQLAKDGQLNLNDKVFNIDGNGGLLDIAPYDGVLGDNRLRDITVQHLLEHRGGWNRDTAGDLAFRDIQIASAMGVPSPPGILNTAKYILSRPLQFTPGADYNYSNVGYMFLGMVVEQISGQAYESYVDTHVLAPAGIPAWEIDAGRTFAVDQNPREPHYSDPFTTQNVYNPTGPNVSWPYGGWDNERLIALGGLIASSKAMAALAKDRIVFGPEIGKLRSDYTTSPEYWWYHGGSLPGTDTLLMGGQGVWGADWKDATYSILFDRRPTTATSYSNDLALLLEPILEGIATWPAPLVYAGDFTNDQWLTPDDIALFTHALALGSESAFTTAYPTARYSAGDFDGNSLVNASDAAGLIGALQHAGVPAGYIALVPELPGDYNRDGAVDAADYVVWRKNFGVSINMPNEIMSLGLVDQADFDVWRSNFGASLGSGSGALLSANVPEPTSGALVLLAIAALFVSRRNWLCLLCAGLPTPHRSTTAGLLVPLSPRRLVSASTALLLCCSTALLISSSPARADIFQWEYINPADPSQGRQQSTTLAPDGAGAAAVPFADLSDRNLTIAYLIGADLSGAYGWYGNLTNADLSQANLTNAYLDGATFAGTDFTHVDERGGEFRLHSRIRDT
jgi:uncharacterized protein YjbI with pentapeptide repeats/CubicO group peptidase (beta-lactamase class C family)